MIKKCQSQFLSVLPDQKKISMTKSAPKMLFFKTYHVTWETLSKFKVDTYSNYKQQRGSSQI